MDPDLVQRAHDALAGITEGPWKAINVGNVHWGVGSGEHDFPTVVKANCGPGGWGNGSSRADAEFISAARQLVPEMMAEIERLREENRRLGNICGWPWSGEPTLSTEVQ